MRRDFSSLAVFLAVPFIASLLIAAPSRQFVRNEPAPITQQPMAKETPTPFKVAPAGAQPRLSQEMQLTGDQTWLDTGIDINVGEHVLITAKGKLRYVDAQNDNGPEGLPRGFKDLLRILPFNGAGRGAVIGRIGDKDTSQSFLIGTKREIVSTTSGRLSIGINQVDNGGADGTYTVRMEVYASDRVALLTVRQANSISGIDNSLFKKIPRRITDKDHNLGDMVNFVILGSEIAMQRVFTNAGWVKVDTDVKDTILHGLINGISKESYLTMPMSQLYLFDRVQDYGWAHAEPISVVASRHHLRIWKAPFTVNGETLWVGAATHDIGFERDQRNNGVTHKIDPDIDLERNYLEKTLSGTGLVSEVARFLPANPMTEARTATGGSFHSNGQVLVLKLGASGTDLSATFYQTFCSVLHMENPDGGKWGACSDYLQTAPGVTSATSQHEFLEIPKDYRVLIIPGVLSSCQSNTQAFAQGMAHLREKHGMTVEFLQMPNASATDNGQKIASYLREAMGIDPSKPAGKVESSQFTTAKDTRKYIIVAYSKGAPDVLEALANDPQAQSAVAAFVTIAGAVGGSPIASALPALFQRYSAALKLGGCEGDMAQAFASLRQDVRKRFLADHPDPLVPSFSLAAVSDTSTTSKMLFEAWRLLTVYDSRTDSQLIQGDTLIPGGNFLGVLRADHLAVALNYESLSDLQVRSVMDHNHYPRTALFESVVRFVISELASGATHTTEKH